MVERRRRKKVHVGFYIDVQTYEELKRWVRDNYGEDVSISEALRSLVLEKIRESGLGEDMVDTAVEEVCRMYTGPGSCIPFYKIEQLIEEHKLPRAKFIRKLQEFTVIKYTGGVFMLCFNQEKVGTVCQKA